MSDPNYPPPPPSYTPPPPPPGGTIPPPGGTVSPNRSIMIVLSYLWLLALIPLLVEKNDPEVQWHAKHGLVLFLAEIAVHVLFFLVRIVLDNIWGGFGCALSFASMFIGLAFLVIRILAIVKGVNGERFIVPGISDYVSRF